MVKISTVTGVWKLISILIDDFDECKILEEKVTTDVVGFLLCGESESHLVLSDSLRPHGLSSAWNSPGQNTGVDGFSLL